MLASFWNQGTVHRILTPGQVWMSGVPHQPSSWSLDLPDPSFLVQEPLPLGWTTCLWETDLTLEEGLGHAPVPRTEVGNWDWGPNATPKLPLLLPRAHCTYLPLQAS